MDKIFDTTRFYRFLMVYMMLYICTIPLASAQGFFTQTNHARGAWNTRFEILPDGYRVKCTYLDPLLDALYHFGDLQLNSEGEEVSWDSISMAGSLEDPDLTWLPDGDIIKIKASLGLGEWTVQKVQMNGNLVWSHSITTESPKQFIQQVKQNSIGEVFLSCLEYDSNFISNKLTIYKFDVNGGLLWSLSPLLPNYNSIGLALTPTQPGGCILSVNCYLTTDTTAYQLFKVSNTGTILWSTNTDYATNYIQENNQGEFFLCGIKYTLIQDTDNTIIEKRAASGQLIWRKDLNTLFQNVSVLASGIMLANDGSILFTGGEFIANHTFQTIFARFDPAGALLWKRKYAIVWDWLHVTGIVTPDNGFILAHTDPSSYNIGIQKIDANGNIYPGQLSGKLAIDDNLSCLIDFSESTLANWKVRLSSANYHLYSTTDSSGHYELLDVPNDDYLLSAIIPSNLWESCAGDVPISVLDTGIVSLTQDLPIQSLVDCPFMTIDIATPVLRRCFANNYSVHYCNEGTVAADSAYIKIHLSPLLDFNFASIPHTQIGNTLYFSLGSVPSLECGDFTFNVTVNCDSTQLGQTLCVSASIFPDTICNPSPNWSGALLEGTGNCLGDSVHFQLHNIGTGASSPGLQSYVVDEHVIMFQQPLPPLAPDAIFNVTVPADGSTWRFIAEQEPNAPGLEMPSIGVEGCGTGGPPTWGFLLQFANHDGNPFSDRDCHEVVGAFDPNDKMAFPIGVQDEHFIEANLPIDYQIRFQNTGTDTAFTVVVKDTISAWLDPATIRPGAASHPYTWALSGEGILTYTFNNILLPDSNINEAASHGFLQFSIQQRKDLQPGTRLENRAGIYFDFNEPVMTNTVFHTIGYDFLPTTATHEATSGLPMLQLWPNPASQTTTLSVGASFQPGQRLLLRNGLGQVVREVTVQGPSMELHRAGLPTGLYFVEWRDERGVLGVGKVIWE
jgi:uncharacterized repeat protein (TIGR01451 family)